MRKNLFLIMLCLIAAKICFAQVNNIDTLITKIANTKDDSTKIALYNQLAWKYIFSDKDNAFATLKTVEKLAQKPGQEYGYNSFLNVKAIYYDVNGLSDSAKVFFDQSLQFSRDHHFQEHEEHTLNNLGMYSWNKGDFEEALNYYFKSLAFAESGLGEDVTKRKDANYNNIGLVYQDMELYEKAIPYHKKALKIRIAKNNNQGQAASYNNLGICYLSLKKYDTAQQSFEKGIEAAKITNDQLGYYRNTQGLADVFAIKNKNQEALELYMESYNRPKNVPFSNVARVHVTSGIAELNLRQKKYKSAIAFGEICVTYINNDTTNDYKETDVYETLAQAYYAVGNIEKGAYYNRKFYEATSEKFKNSTAKALQELETKYETQKKEIELQKSKAEISKNKLKIKQKNTLLYSALGLAFLLSLIGFLVYKQLKLKNEQIVKENELKQALIKIENQNNLQEQRLAISKDLHDNIGSQLTFIISALDNLKYFEFAKDKLYQKFDSIGNFTRNTITDLRDTIWAMNKEEITFEDLKTRITNFIEAAKTSLLGINFEFHYPESTSQFALSSKQGIDVYRIIQEAVNNAVKHAMANKIEVNFEHLDHSIVVSISDNGVGFNKEKIEQGNGLSSMQMRAKEINADFSIEPLEKGTKVSLKFTVI
jgi:signal transduction histidine kinase/tetratricopeptide (TPR) repeat protein